jgi:hypothetical protein
MNGDVVGGSYRGAQFGSVVGVVVAGATGSLVVVDVVPVAPDVDALTAIRPPSPTNATPLATAAARRAVRAG